MGTEKEHFQGWLQCGDQTKAMGAMRGALILLAVSCFSPWIPPEALTLAAAVPVDPRFSAPQRPTQTAPPAPISRKHPPGNYAVFDTTKGRIICQLFPEQAPKTVDNFVQLTNGTKRWYDMNKKAWVRRRFYDGLIFHRVIPDFMIQGGDQLGTGRGQIGYRFEDEFRPDLKFDQPGRLAMANAGPNTNGSQFFITVAPTAWLNHKHTILGQVVEGQEVAEAIANVPRDSQDRPLTPVVIQRLSIVEVK